MNGLNRWKRVFSPPNETPALPNYIVNLAWLDTTNSVMYVLLESIDLMLLKLTRLALGATEHLKLGTSQLCQHNFEHNIIGH